MSDEKMEEIRNLEKYYRDRVENFKQQVSVLFSVLTHVIDRWFKGSLVLSVT